MSRVVHLDSYRRSHLVCQNASRFDPYWPNCEDREFSCFENNGHGRPPPKKGRATL